MNRKWSYFIVFTSLAVVGSFLKIPSSIGSVAFDSFPALVAASILSPVWGMGTAAFGHIMSAALDGFPLGPLHVIIAVQMVLIVGFYGWLYRRNWRIPAVVSFVIGNGVLAPICFWLILGRAMAVSLIPSLTAAATLNSVVAFLVAPRLSKALSARAKKGFDV